MDSGLAKAICVVYTTWAAWHALGWKLEVALPNGPTLLRIKHELEGVQLGATSARILRCGHDIDTPNGVIGTLGRKASGLLETFIQISLAKGEDGMRASGQRV